MTRKQTVIDAQTVASGGGTVSGVATKPHSEQLHLEVESSSGGADVSVDVTGGKLVKGDDNMASVQDGDSYANIDVSTGGVLFPLPSTDGYEVVEITITNNAASSATLSVYAVDY